MWREIAEEIGYRVKHLKPIATFYLSPGGSSERVFLFYAEVRPGDRIPDHERKKGPEEDIVLVELPLRELPESVLEGEFRDAKTIIAVSWLTQRLARAAGTTVVSLVSKRTRGSIEERSRERCRRKLVSLSCVRRQNGREWRDHRVRRRL